jgi:ribosomal protein L37E
VNIFLIPTLLLMGLFAAAMRLRHHIDPSCPACGRRAWQDAPGDLACGACGWSSVPQPATAPERQAA